MNRSIFLIDQTMTSISAADQVMIDLFVIGNDFAEIIQIAISK